MEEEAEQFQPLLWRELTKPFSSCRNPLPGKKKSTHSFYYTSQSASKIKSHLMQFTSKGCYFADKLHRGVPPNTITSHQTTSFYQLRSVMAENIRALHRMPARKPVAESFLRWTISPKAKARWPVPAVPASYCQIVLVNADFEVAQTPRWLLNRHIIC